MQGSEPLCSTLVLCHALILQYTIVPHDLFLPHKLQQFVNVMLKTWRNNSVIKCVTLSLYDVCCSGELVNVSLEKIQFKAEQTEVVQAHGQASH